ncbi:MAG: hypothetical protein Q8L36_02425 [bacterium]|nr:hypothetical protein [bacterium]
MKKRKIAALLVIMLGITGSLLINSKASNSQQSTTDKILNSIEANDLDYAKAGESGQNTDLTNNSLASANITETITNVYLEEFFQKNQNLLGNPEELKNKVDLNLNDLVLPENIENNVFFFKPFQINDFRKTTDNSPAVQLTYLKKIGELNQKNFSRINKSITNLVDNWLEKNDASGLKTYLQGAGQQIKDLQEITVPPNWEQFHLQNLNLWQKKAIIYQAILNSEIDPLKTYLAIQEIPNIASENDNLQSIVNKQYSELINQ